MYTRWLDFGTLSGFISSHPHKNVDFGPHEFEENILWQIMTGSDLENRSKEYKNSLQSKRQKLAGKVNVFEMSKDDFSSCITINTQMYLMHSKPVINLYFHENYYFTDQSQFMIRQVFISGSFDLRKVILCGCQCNLMKYQTICMCMIYRSHDHHWNNHDNLFHILCWLTMGFKGVLHPM